MRHLNVTVSLFLIATLVVAGSCNKSSSGRNGVDTSGINDTDTTYGEDTSQHFFYMDTVDREAAWNRYFKVVNLLEFHTRDTMHTDSTYLATLSMGKNISSAELALKVGDILEPGGGVKLRDTTQQISMYMKATLQDKAPPTDPSFHIVPIGDGDNFRTYDTAKNKMVWQWNVTPRKEGNHMLILSISHVTETGKPLASPETRKHSITIFSSRKNAGIVKNVGNFFAQYWQWLLGAVALPLFIAWFTTKRRQQNAAQQDVVNRPVSTNWKRKRRNR